MEVIAKQRLNIILLVDVSSSMRGKRIEEVNSAIADIISYLKDYEKENTNLDFYLSIIKFGTEMSYGLKERVMRVDDISFEPIKAKGYSNLHLAYTELASLLEKESKGGIMPDFGGVAPILVLLTDGHPTKYPITKELELLKEKAWFRISLRYGIAIELNDKKTIGVLRDFVLDKGDVISCYNSNLLKEIIKVIVVTASMVKSTGSSVHNEKRVSITEEAQLKIQDALMDIEECEW